VQSRESDLEKRRKIVCELDRQLLDDGASLYNGSRFEDIWLDK
jgi:hypothetical protein